MTPNEQTAVEALKEIIRQVGGRKLGMFPLVTKLAESAIASLEASPTVAVIVDADRLAVGLYLWTIPSLRWHQLDEVDRTFWRGYANAMIDFCKGKELPEAQQ